ncbi:hypothetical protein U9M48_026516 [Paspalum notatum var. saurae]|uniref:Uncharacterized protein n=1 Tax=Paspalum notatum var. saurae TaxID=547442 RepID=A0AAQ3TR32_PASNO
MAVANNNYHPDQSPPQRQYATTQDDRIPAASSKKAIGQDLPKVIAADFSREECAICLQDFQFSMQRRRSGRRLAAPTPSTRTASCAGSAVRRSTLYVVTICLRGFGGAREDMARAVYMRGRS